jgi:hypothetical protein
MKIAFFRTACRPLAGALAIFVAAPACVGQTVRPLINELNNPAKGRVEYVNDGITPLNVVLEAKSFTVSETGEVTYRPLAPDIHLKLSATSFRVQPQQTYYVFYEASAPKTPTWFVIYASFSGYTFRTAQGMNVRLQLPHTVYLLPKQPVAQADIHVIRAELRPAENKVLLEVENTGDNFGRILQTELMYSKKKQQEAPGFPVFPHSKRILEVALDEKAEGENVPVEVSLQFEKFKLEEKLQRHNAETVATIVPVSSAASGSGAKP